MIEVDALLFDLDGTLVDSRRDLTTSVHWIQARYGIRKSNEADVASFIGDGVTALVQRALPKLEREKLPRAVEEFKSHYRIHCLDSTRLLPDAAETIHHFRNKRLGVVTNKPQRETEHILDSLGLLGHFRCVLGGDMLRWKKPDPEPLRIALLRLGAGPGARAVMVGDSANDVRAGHATGIYTCGVRGNIASQKQLVCAHPDFLIKRLGYLRHFFS